MNNNLEQHKISFENIYALRGNVESWVSTPDYLFEFRNKTYLKRNREISNRVPLCNRILDVGCGVGDLIIQLSGKCRRIDGVDISESNVMNASINTIHIKNSHIWLMPAEDLSFAVNTFDVVVCADVIEHVFDEQKTLSEIFRILLPGGILILTTPNKYIDILWQIADYPVLAILKIIRRTITPKAKDSLLTKRQLIELLQSVGFSIRQYDTIEAYPRCMIITLLMRILDKRSRKIAEAILSFIANVVEKTNLFNYRQIVIAGKDA